MPLLISVSFSRFLLQVRSQTAVVDVRNGIGVGSKTGGARSEATKTVTGARGERREERSDEALRI